MSNEIVLSYQRDDDSGYLFDTYFDVELNIGAIILKGRVTLAGVETDGVTDSFVYRFTEIENISIAPEPKEDLDQDNYEYNGYLPVGDFNNG